MISADGTVVYDSSVENRETMENHLAREEVQSDRSAHHTEQQYEGQNQQERIITTCQRNSTHTTSGWPRNTILISGSSRSLDYLFFIFIALLFVIIWILLAIVTRWFGRSITTLRDFASRVRRGEGNDPTVIFPKNEIGETGKEIVRIYNNLAKNAEELTLQKEKLFRHLHVLNEGVAFFSPIARSHSRTTILWCSSMPSPVTHTLATGRVHRPPSFAPMKLP
ncbi:MAG: hypothetical protein MZV63_38805 [Marinilabiliales bacterium]|nr:hypothetical protein [Marinilabiliales bacterium]